MKVLLLVFAFLVGTTLGLPTPTEILSGSKCFHDVSTDTIDCSTVTNPDDIVFAMQGLSTNGMKNFDHFRVTNNAILTHLPHAMLGDVQFKVITITNNTNLSSVSDILGSSKTSALEIDLSWNRLSYLSRMEASSLTKLKINGPYMTSIAASALNAVPKLQTLELQDAGSSSNGLVISEGVFMNLPNLQELNMKGYAPKDGLAAKGTFNFNSNALHTVNLISSRPIFTAEEGAFAGFKSGTTLSILLNAPISIPSFYNVFNSGSRVVVQELQPCGCNLDWVKFSCFQSQLTVRCVYGGQYYDFPDVPADNFASCCFGK